MSEQQPEAITRDELAAALARRHPDKPRDSAESLARALFADVRCCRPEPWQARAEAAEARLAEIAAHCRLRMNAPGRSGMTMAAVGLILGIAEGGEEARDG